MKNLLIPTTDYQSLVQSVVMSIKMSGNDKPNIAEWAKTALDAYLKDSYQMEGMAEDIMALLSDEPAPKPAPKPVPKKS